MKEPLYCDNHILVMEKPAGIATQPDFLELARDWVKKKYQKPGKVFLEPIHRLDKPVRGIVVFARTSKALIRLNEMMRERKISKLYRAYVEGSLPSAGRLEHYLVHDEFRARLSTSGAEGAKQAVLDYKVLDTKDGASLVEISLLTGRYHQIRAQFSAIGSPILGDTRYGSRKSWPKEGIALTAAQIALIHPVTHQPLTFCLRDL
jgi:23S rRNA pseudouridine1911/1915/1917 synthase